MAIIVHFIHKPEEQESAFQIRKQVFVIEQNVPEDLEYDEFEESSRHFLAIDEATQQACGTARWRFTEKGIKLERFAVLDDFRSRGVGSALVKALLNDIAEYPEAKGKLIYLHAQVSAMKLYQKFDFQAVGEMFEEADIQHYKMIKKPD